jgi:heat shock protein HslJ
VVGRWKTSSTTSSPATRWSAAAAVLVALTALGLAGCGSGDSGSEASDDSLAAEPGQPVTTEDLEGTEWTSTNVSGHELVDGSTITLGFGSGMSVAAGCNTIGAEYAVSEDGTLAWTSEPASTMMACSDELEAQDQWLTQLFTDGVNATTEGTDLKLTSGEVTIELAE